MRCSKQFRIKKKQIMSNGTKRPVRKWWKYNISRLFCLSFLVFTEHLNQIIDRRWLLDNILQKIKQINWHK